MFSVLSSAWALLLGMMLLQVGNGMQGTLLGIRGEIEGFSTLQMSLVMSGYFVGFLFGSRMAPDMIRRVGHVRVFAALASLISAVMILYPTFADPYAWGIGRILIGFCFSGVYVTAESWLNEAASNENRGKALSLYMIVQMVGIVSAQALMLVADPGGFVLFIIPSVLISLAFAPILLSISPTPAFDTAKPLSLRQIMKISPLGCVGMFLLGGVFSAQFGMAPVYGAEVGLTVAQISTFVSTFFVGAMVLQFPIGWLSDRMDRRLLILIAAAICGLGGVVGAIFGSFFPALLLAGLMVGGMSNPLYSLLIAYTNDFLNHEDMAAAAGGMVFINGLGAVAGPVATGWLMGQLGAWAFFLVISVLCFAVTAYAAYRMTQRAAPSVDETESFTMVSMSASPMAVNLAAEYDYETAQDEQEAG
ncbi:MFS transporter [Roseovarius indicus]|uniref:Major facilitator transporter n=1 Tax=Roseovarius indicus TaxID=540747 RepID=A0A0T5P9C4_9RHOB|nr:MFS transporter [Roseovarius indicus]KRS17897.1 major facilitator transporter [Roseovarius indicus]OAO06456.1 MFS transporter [Roseovarius indicus]QEW27292.1 putative MFS-type transporter YcaD [Roseovarius indicus]SFD50781.1 Predicted arabinose efflux permease, MFS family [Roseovarius indicus]